MANSNVAIRIDANLKKQADILFDELGMSFTTAVNVFVKQALREAVLPFERTLHPHKCPQRHARAAHLAPAAAWAATSRPGHRSIGSR